MIIAITGTPGTGKTTLARKIAKLGFKYVDGKKIGEKISESYDEEAQTHIVDEKKFAKKVVEEIKKIRITKKKADYAKLNKLLNNKNKVIKINEKTQDVIIDSHLSHYLSKKQVDLVIVTRCDISILKQRLSKRKYPAKKIEENIEAEIFDVCGSEAKDAGHKTIYVEN